MSKYDEDSHLNNLLVGVKGSLTEERRLVRPKSYYKQIKESRKLNNKFKLSINQIFSCPQLIEKKPGRSIRGKPEGSSNGF